MPKIGNALAQPQTGNISFPQTSGVGTALSTFTLQTPSQGINLFETFTNSNGAIILGMRSVMAGRGIKLIPSQGIIYISVDTTNVTSSSDSPVLTGVPRAPTAAPGTDSDQIATTGFVAANFLSSNSPQLTGTPRAPTASPGTHSDQIATTEFVSQGYAPLDSPHLTGISTAPTASPGDHSDQLATNAFVQTATGGYTTLDFTGQSGNQTLVAAQYGNKVIILKGTPQGSVTVVFPRVGHWVVLNRTSSLNTVNLTTSGGIPLLLSQNSSMEVIADGTNVVPANLYITQQVGDSSINVATTQFVQNIVGSTDNASGNTVTTITTQGGTSVLTPLQYGKNIISVVRGASPETTTATLIMPANGFWLVLNRLATHTVIVKTAGGVGVTIDVGYNALVVADGINVVLGHTDYNGITLLGNCVAVTQLTTDKSTRLATTAYVKNQFSSSLILNAAGTALTVNQNASIGGTLTANAITANGAITGSVLRTTDSTTGATSGINIFTGAGPTSGDLSFASRDASNGSSGSLTLGTGSAFGSPSGASGWIDIGSGWANEAGQTSGDIYLYSGNVTNGAGRSGTLGLSTGQTNIGVSGDLLISTGSSTTASSGIIHLSTGSGGSNSGDIEFTIGTASTPGNLKLVNLPTIDPVVDNAFWLDSGVLVRSGSTSFHSTFTTSILPAIAPTPLPTLFLSTKPGYAFEAQSSDEDTDTDTGWAYLHSGNATGTGASGEGGAGSGNTEAGTSGWAYLYSGDSTAGSSGNTLVQTGAANGAGHVSGNIVLRLGSADNGAMIGNIKFENYKTVDPGIQDMLWFDNGVAVLSGSKATPINIPQNARSAAYTTVLDDQGKHIFHPSTDTTARTFTIASNATAPYPLGTAISFVNQNGAGIVTIAIASDTLRLAGLGITGSRVLAANGMATAIKIATTEWLISGTGLT